MKPVDFPEANCTFGAPPNATLEIMPVRAFHGQFLGGSEDGTVVVVTAWEPDKEDIKAILEGKPVFITMIGGLAPHALSTKFATATFRQ